MKITGQASRKNQTFKAPGGASAVGRLFETIISQPAQEQTVWVKPIAKPRPRIQMDILLFLVVFTLLIFGLLMVFSASYDYSLAFYDDPYRIFFRQLAWLVFGLVVLSATAIMDYHYWKVFSVPVMGATILALFGVLLVNEVRNNAARTLMGGSIQPSELAKFMTVIYLAVWLFSKRERLSDINFGLIPMALILGILGGLIFLQPDLSAVVTVFILGGLMFFLAGGDLKQILFLLVVALLVGYAIFMIHPTGSSRIQGYIEGINDPTQGPYHVRRSFEAFVKGGLFGVGIGKAETKMTGLPVPPTDSIFAVVGEETGLLGSLGLISLYAILLWRGLVIANKAPDEMGALMAAGLSIWIALEAFINMAVMVNLLPFAGNALPMISAGGSNLVISLAAVGVLLNISRQSARSREANGNFTSPVVDLRRRNRGGRVPGPGRSASPVESSDGAPAGAEGKQDEQN